MALSAASPTNRGWPRGMFCRWATLKLIIPSSPGHPRRYQGGVVFKLVNLQATKLHVFIVTLATKGVGGNHPP